MQNWKLLRGRLKLLDLGWLLLGDDLNLLDRELGLLLDLKLLLQIVRELIHDMLMMKLLLILQELLLVQMCHRSCLNLQLFNPF